MKLIYVTLLFFATCTILYADKQIGVVKNVFLSQSTDINSVCVKDEDSTIVKFQLVGCVDTFFIRRKDTYGLDLNKTPNDKEKSYYKDYVSLLMHSAKMGIKISIDWDILDPACRPTGQLKRVFRICYPECVDYYF